MSMNRTRPNFATRRALLALAAGGVAVVLAACGGGGSGTAAGSGGSSGAWTPYKAAAGDTVPTVKVKFGMRPYADNTFYVIGIKKGWFSDLGIQLDPADGISTTEDQWTNLLLHGSTDINTDTCAILVTTYSSSHELKCIQHGVSFFGQVMFANPKLHLKSVEDYVAAGEPFKTALQHALEPLTKGDSVYVPPGTGEITFTQESFKYAGLKLPNFKPVTDSDMFTQAQAGKINFLHPGGAPIAVELIKLGWKPIFSTKTLIEGAKDDPKSPFTGLVVNNGIAATGSYASSHEDTILRFTSVMYRIAAETAKDPSLFDLQAPYLNSVAGTDLTGKEIADEFAQFHPLITFKQAGEDYYTTPSSSQYYKTIGEAVIRDQVAAGAIPKGITADDFIWADKIYTDLASYKKGYEDLAAKPGGDSALMTKAKQYYDWYDYLDAYRFAMKATS
jgi:ABC-type nitrate/sulfonate/bicarbonate transport system substrate-binding protein